MASEEDAQTAPIETPLTIQPSSKSSSSSSAATSFPLILNGRTFKPNKQHPLSTEFRIEDIKTPHLQSPASSSSLTSPHPASPYTPDSTTESQTSSESNQHYRSPLSGPSSAIASQNSAEEKEAEDQFKFVPISSALPRRSSQSITAKTLLNWMSKSMIESSDPLDNQLLLLDIRPSSSFQTSHLRNSYNLVLPPIFLKRHRRGSVVTFVLDSFIAHPEDGGKLFRSKVAQSKIVLIDSNMTEKTNGSQAYLVLQTLEKDPSIPTQNIFWLMNGFEAFQKLSKENLEALQYVYVADVGQDRIVSGINLLLRDMPLGGGEDESDMSLASASSFGSLKTGSVNGAEEFKLMKSKFPSHLRVTSSAPPNSEATPPFLDFSLILPKLYLGVDPATFPDPAGVMRRLEIDCIINVAEEIPDSSSLFDTTTPLSSLNGIRSATSISHCSDNQTTPSDTIQPMTVSVIKDYDPFKKDPPFQCTTMNDSPKTMIYKKYDLRDNADEDIDDALVEIVDYIDAMYKKEYSIYVHCVAGKSRSPTIIIAFLMKHLNCSVEESYEFLSRRRIGISPNIGFMASLKRLEFKNKSNGIVDASSINGNGSF